MRIAETEKMGADRRAIVAGGLLAGALDISWASTQALAQGRQPARLLQSIASGVLGSAAYDYGIASVALGLLLHFTIALAASAVYFLASRLWPWLHRRFLVAGTAFGIGVYFFMQVAVIPLSRLGARMPLTPRGMALGLAAHILCVGLPIAWTARRWARLSRR